MDDEHHPMGKRGGRPGLREGRHAHGLPAARWGYGEDRLWRLAQRKFNTAAKLDLVGSEVHNRYPLATDRQAGENQMRSLAAFWFEPSP